MARKPGAGRKAAKNEVAAALIAALKFGGVLKAATTTSPVQAHFAWLNTGTAVMTDGVVAAGHPIPPDISGYPNTKLLLEALENTDKNFTLVVHDNGEFEISSDRFNGVVHSLEYDKVIPMPPDNAQMNINQPDALVAALNNALKVTTESGDTVLYSSVRFTGNSIMATNGAVMLETRYDEQLPPIIVPRQFVTSVVKAAANHKPVSIGLGHDWKTFTVWFENGAWLRTNVYEDNVWPEDALNLFYRAIGNNETPPTPLDNKVWAAINSLLPFTDEDNRLIIRNGFIRTHVDRTRGAVIELKDVNFEFDVNGKSFAALTDIVTMVCDASGFEMPVLLVYGDNCRGIVAGLKPLPEPVATTTNWGQQASPQGAETVGGWHVQTAEPQTETQPASERPSGDLNPTGKWPGGPTVGTAQSAEFQAVYQGQPEENFLPEIEDSYVIVAPGDQGIALQPASNDGQFKPSEWANNLTDADAGFKQDNNNNGW